MNNNTKFYVKVGCLGLICVMMLSAMIVLVAINVSNDHGHGSDVLTSDSGAALSADARAKWLAYQGDESASYGRVYDPSLLNLSDNKTLQVMAEAEGMQDFKNLDRTDTGGSNYSDSEGMGAGDDDDDKAPAADDNSENGGETREVEEADIVKAVGNTEYVLNPYKGLMIIDLTFPDSPVVEGKAKVLGNPVEMYVVDFLAFIIVNKNYDYYYSYWMYGDGAKADTNYIGTEMVVVNCLDHENPKVVKTFDIQGFASNSRRVGEVIYVVTNTYSWYGYYGSMDPSDMTYITSVSFKDPSKVGMVEQIAFSGSTNQIFASPTALFVAQTEYIYTYWWGDDDIAMAEDANSGDVSPEEKWADDMYRTNLTYVDIHDPDGDIAIMDNVTIPGEVTSRFQMDHYKDNFRVVTHHQVDWSSLGSSTLWIYDVSEPSQMKMVGSLDIDDAGNLMATRFAGERAYTIHLPHSIDPLDVLDLSDPTDPKLCDMLEMPGWVTYMDVRGYNIIALGVDDSTGARKVALSLFDVTDPNEAVLLDRVSIGEGSSYSGANWDDKQLSIIDEDSMVLIPYEAESSADGQYMWGYGVQIVTFDLKSGDLALRGSAKTPDMVIRTRVVSDRIVATSSERLTVIDARSLDSPTVSATLELAPNVVDSFQFGDYSINMVQGYYDNGISFYVAPSTNPDTFSPLSRLETGADYGVALANEPYIYLIGSDYIYEQKTGTSTTDNFVKVYDFTDPLAPVLKGKYSFPSGIYLDLYYYYGYGYGYSSGQSQQKAIQIDPDHLAVITTNYDYSGSNCEIFVIDITNPASPVKDTSIKLGLQYPESTVLVGTKLYLSEYEYYYDYEGAYGYYYYENHYLTIIDLADPSNPVVTESISVPGPVVGASPDGRYIYTRSQWYNQTTYITVNTFDILSLDSGVATLLTAFRFDQYVNNIVVEGSMAYIGLGGYEYRYYYGYMEDDMGGVRGAENEPANSKLIMLDLTDPESPMLAQALVLPQWTELAQVSDGLIMLTPGSSGQLLIYDASIRGAILLTGLYSIPGYSNTIRVYDDNIYVISGNYGVTRISAQTGAMW